MNQGLPIAHPSTLAPLFVQNLPVAAAMFDREMNCLCASQRWQQLGNATGHNSQDWLNHLGLAPEQWQILFASCLSGQTETLETAVEQPTSSIQWLRWEIAPWYNSQGSIEGVMVVATDISQGKQAEVALTQTRLELESRVKERTQRLQQMIERLQYEVAERQEAEDALYQQQQLEQVILDLIPGTIWLKDTQNNILRANQAAAQAIGLPLEEIAGRSMAELFPEQAEQYYQFDLEVIQSGLPKLGIIEQLPALAGEKRWVRTDRTPYWNEDGEIAGVVTLTTDITDLKQIEETLRTSQQRLSLLIAQAPLAVIELNPEFQVMAWNPAAERMFGYTSAEAIGRHPVDITVPATARDMVHQVFQTLLTQRQGGHSTNENLTKDGRIIVCEWYNTPLIDAHGELVGVLAMAMDVTDRQAAENALRYSEQRFRDISEAAGEYIWEMDASGCYTFVSDKSISVKGYSPAMLLGHSLFEFMPAEDVAPVQAILKRAATARSSFQLEHRNVTPAGEIVWEAVNGVPLLDETGAIAGFRGAAMSITARKQAEEALRESEAQSREQARQLEQTLRELQQTQAKLVQTEKMSSLGQLVAGVAHEINNPVNFIYGNLAHAGEYIHDLLRLLSLYQKHYPTPAPEIQAEAEAIDLGFLTSDLLKLLSSMKVGADRIQSIVLALRTFSRMDEAEVKPVNIHDGIDSTLMILQSRLKGKPGQSGIEVVKEYGNLPLVECYAGQLNQAFMNILSNAIDALDETIQQGARSQIRIRTELWENGQGIRIRIADNGPGIPDTVRQRLFEPFFTTKPIGKGTGLGLSISYQVVVDRHRGNLQCFSAPGQGAEFVIEIPLRQGVS